FFIRPEINGKSKLLFKPPATAKPAAIRSLPCAGEGRGEGTFQVAATSPKSLSLLKHKPCGLLPSL
ncbi:TPA: hypothetical protein ACKN05_002244, partial [Neisseria gonorrhoeae]